LLSYLLEGNGVDTVFNGGKNSISVDFPWLAIDDLGLKCWFVKRKCKNKVTASNAQASPLPTSNLLGKDLG